MPHLSDSITVGPLTIRNRIWQPPMCMYSATHDGVLVGAPHDFHVGHYGQRAAGGMGLVIVEATGVVPEGRISPYCLGIWNETQEKAHARIAAQIKEHGATAGIQLAHAGRKASTAGEIFGGAAIAPGKVSPEGAAGWEPVAPSALAFPELNCPRALTVEEIATTVHAFACAAQRAERAGYQFLQIHAAHGYLIHEFLSPLSNTRQDDYGGSFDNRIRFLREIVAAVKAAVSPQVAVGVRLSSTDWFEENGEKDTASWTVQQSIQLVDTLIADGVDTFDISSAGNYPVKLPHDRDYQVSKAIELKEATGACISGVGRISDPHWAEELVSAGSLDAVSVARACLLDPAWANNALHTLGQEPFLVAQYRRGVFPRSH